MAHFVRVWLATLAALAVAVLGLTFAVDPYGVFGTPPVSGWTDRKTAAVDVARLTKPILVARAAPRTLVLGSSVVDVGIDPDSPAWSLADRPVFNLGIPGASPVEQLRFLRNALAVSQPRRLFIAATFDDALWSPDRDGPGSAPHADPFTQRLPIEADGTGNPAAPAGKAANFVYAAWSLQAVRDSLATLVQGVGRATAATASAQTAQGRNTADTFRRWTRAEGAAALFEERERSKAAFLATVRATPRVTIVPIGDAVRLAQAHGMDVVVFIPTLRIEELELYHQAGLDGVFLAWKAQLMETVARAATPGHPVPVWDFSGATPYAVEPVPAPGDTATSMRWAWDLVHFRAELGTAMIHEMLDGGRPGELGALAMPAAPASPTDAYAAARQAWSNAHPAEAEHLDTMMTQAIQAACATKPSACLSVTR